ncbi:MAG: hypothetical protein IKE27_05400 [Oscillospiraceae bacterium]|nr:hypothetical protein [Oscillospiraceae bacterium]
MERKKITDIHCSKCGAPAYFDIVKQRYVCGYCGGEVGIREAIEQKKYFRTLQAGRLKESVGGFSLMSATCTGCGAVLVFNKDEALSNCAFCGRSLVRTDYLYRSELPESVIPFAVTEKEAKDRLTEWCNKNRGKPEATHIMSHIEELKGFYLPYEMVRGPVHMGVSRIDRGRRYRCEGFINDEFVNTSSQLDNLLLDGLEPFDFDALTEFDFAYVAGHRVKTSDIGARELEERVKKEVGETYRSAVRKTLETKAVDIDANVSEAVRLPVLLPVYYIAVGDTMAAVNGQTGKVSVRAEKERKYYFLPWWFKALLATVVILGGLFAGFRIFGMAAPESLFLTAILGFFFIIVTLCLYSDTPKNKFSVSAGREIYTSGERVFRRVDGELVPTDGIVSHRVTEPVFFMDIRGQVIPVWLRFTTPYRVFRMILLSVVVMFLPVIIGLFLNGFNLSMIHLGGSAVWFCIMIPIIPVYILKLGIVEMYEKPWIYIVNRKGKWERYRRRIEKPNKEDVKSTIGTILRVVFVPPISLAVWFGIISFFVICYLTAGYGW